MTTIINYDENGNGATPPLYRHVYTWLGRGPNGSDIVEEIISTGTGPMPNAMNQMLPLNETELMYMRQTWDHCVMSLVEDEPQTSQPEEAVQ